MFGAVAYLPVYFQVVEGTSATISGLRLFPLMAGFMAASIMTGRAITHLGRYRIFPIIGMAIMVVGIYLLSRLDEYTSPWEGAGYMLFLGIGLGMVLQVPVLAVQNAVMHKDLGASTAGINLWRSLGSAFGVAIFGSILNNRLTYELERALPAGTLGQFSRRTLTASPAQLKALPADIHAGVVHAFAASLHTVFLWAVPLIFVGFMVSWLLREMPLRARAYVGWRAEGSSETLQEPAAE